MVALSCSAWRREEEEEEEDGGGGRGRAGGWEGGGGGEGTSERDYLGVQAVQLESKTKKMKRGVEIHEGALLCTQPGLGQLVKVVLVVLVDQHW